MPSKVYLKYHVQRWDRNTCPYIGGGYAIDISGKHENPDYPQVLTQPEYDGRLPFAGEATNIEGAGTTVEAAMVTGRRAAKEALALLASIWTTA